MALFPWWQIDSELALMSPFFDDFHLAYRIEAKPVETAESDLAPEQR